MTREQKIVKAQALRDKGKSLEQIAVALGVSRTTAYRWLTPKAAERDRVYARGWKERNRGVCEVCGVATWTGSTRCIDHYRGRERRRAEAAERVRAAQALRRRGLLNYEIAERMGTTAAVIASLLKRPNVARYGIEHVPTPYGAGHPNRLAQRKQAA